jgi:catecholate siderophore receptor
MYLRAIRRPLLGTMTACLATTAGWSAKALEAPANTDADGDGDKDRITVTGVRSLINDKLGEVHDTPQSVSIIDEKAIQDQAFTRLEDALKTVPGITLNVGEGAARGDTVNLRGFSAFNDFFLDGIRDAAVYDRDSFNLEQIEVVKGPSAVLFGRGSTGGVINQVSKAAQLSAFTHVTIEGGTNTEGRGTADVNMPIASDTAIRLNVMGETSEVTDRDDVKNKRWGFAPTITWGIDKPDTITLAYLHQEENNRPDVGIPFLNGQPAPVNRQGDYGLLDDNQTANDDIVTLRAKHDFNETLTISDTARYANYQYGYFFAAPNFGKEVITAATPLSAILVGRDAPSSSGTQTNLDNQTDVTWRVRTGFVAQKIVAGAELSRETYDLTRYANPFNTNNIWVPETPLLSPNPNTALPNEPASSIGKTTAFSQAFYLTDTISLGNYVDVIAGVRHDRFDATYNALTVATRTVSNLDHTDNLWSPRAAIVVKPTEEQSYYVSYGTSFDPSAEALSLTAKTANLGPVKAKTYEVGGKIDWLDGRLNSTGALFNTEVDNAQTNDPDNPTLTVLNGDQRVRGAEFGLNGYLTDHWEISAAYTYLDGVTLSSGTAAYVGKQMPNVAKNSANLWTEYEITDQFEAGAGFTYLGHRFADSGQVANLPSYVVWNAMASYKINDQIKVQVNGLNLLDKTYYSGSYYTSAAENHVIPGAGRTVKFSTALAF